MEIKYGEQSADAPKPKKLTHLPNIPAFYYFASVHGDEVVHLDFGGCNHAPGVLPGLNDALFVAFMQSKTPHDDSMLALNTGLCVEHAECLRDNNDALKDFQVGSLDLFVHITQTITLVKILTYIRFVRLLGEEEAAQNFYRYFLKDEEAVEKAKGQIESLLTMWDCPQLAEGKSPAKELFYETYPVKGD